MIKHVVRQALFSRPILVFLLLVLPLSGAVRAQEPDNAVVNQLTAPLGAANTAEQRSMTPAELFATLSQSAAEGRAPAMYDLAVLYERGLGTTRNFSRALEWYQKAADADLPGAYQQLGLAYERGQGTETDQKKADEAFQKAAELKLPEASYRLALRTLSSPPAKGTEQKALDSLKAAGLSSAQAQEALGTFYEQGLVGGAPNFTKALEWYEKAAKAGAPQAYVRVGVCYELGLGTSVDLKIALVNYQSAADKKVPEGAYKIAAFSMANGDQKKALEYLNQAAALGHAQAANELGVVYLEGQFGEKVNADQALAMFTRSAELGNPEAMKNMAVIYKDGLAGRKSDPVQALKWYLLAHKGGYQPEGLAPIIDGVKKGLNETQLKQAETEANKWLTDFAKEREAAQ